MNEEYTLDLKKAEFRATFESDNFLVEHQVLVHRAFPHSIVNVVSASSKKATGESLTVDIALEVGEQSEDITETETVEIKLPNNTLGITKIWYRCETTLEVEFSHYQPEPTPVCFAWMEPWESGIHLNGEYPQLGQRVFLTVVDNSIEDIIEEILKLATDPIDKLLNLHYSGWEDIWSNGVVQLESEDEALPQILLASQYYLYSSLPYPAASKRPLPDFCGLSPGSLNYGQKGRDYQGHSFWDTATWMYPPVLVLQPDMARKLLDYRWSRLRAALDYAANTGWQGARFPWESAYTGGEVCPDWAAETRDNQHHITGDISFAVRQFLAVTGDTDIFTDSINSMTGCEFVRAAAEFWANRAEYNAATNQYDIKGVMGPDEYHGTTDNNLYTNVVGGLAIFFAQYASCVADCDEIPEDWIDVARKLSLQYDEVEDYHPQYEGYEKGTKIKQADTILVGYPLMYGMNVSTRRNDLEMYEAVTDIGGPAMTWGMHAIGHLELGEEYEAEDLFKMSYEPYTHPPFFMWTENIMGNGAINFITGMGGFLQAVIFGYLGIRTRLDRMDFDPKLPTGCSSMNASGINYHDAQFNLIVSMDMVNIEVVNSGSGLKISQDGETIEVGEPDELALFRRPFTIVPVNVDYLSKCDLPLDKIGE